MFLDAGEVNCGRPAAEEGSRRAHTDGVSGGYENEWNFAVVANRPKTVRLMIFFVK